MPVADVTTYKPTLPAWQQLYQRLQLNQMEDVVTYQVNGHLYIVVSLEDRDDD